jgi:hypothetical protein
MTKQTIPEYSSWGRGEEFLKRLLEELKKEEKKN